ncbi:MAG: 16S rRNA (guanine(966)-N(2))-methyltransferase RsmD [Spirochaetales bacterium]|nr:16S rRNA (guanine(966)-N(2))-methyltransferase RsmD [Spirochaetales bacterium]
MRITGGYYKGRKIICPPGIIRPAMDRMRESLFSILGNLEQMSFLDLYSGSGIVGIEAASRGAEPVFLVERDIKKKLIIEKNISFVESRIHLIITPCERYIKKTKERFDIVYCDPPFRTENKSSIISLIHKSGILKKDGTIIIHVPTEDQLPESYGSLLLSDKRKYGQSVLYFYCPG